MVSRRMCCLWGVVAAALIVVWSTDDAPASPPHDGVSQWQWLEGTTWAVPTDGLPAIGWLTQQESAIPLVDQTVYTIDDFVDGYFTARTTASFNGFVQCRWLLGSITPAGDVLLTFIPRAGVEETTTQGIGRMERHHGQWTMVNQMTSPVTDLGFVAHWAPMQRVEPGDAAWESLPGVDLSVPVFISACWDG